MKFSANEVLMKISTSIIDYQTESIMQSYSYNHATLYYSDRLASLLLKTKQMFQNFRVVVMTF